MPDTILLPGQLPELSWIGPGAEVELGEQGPGIVLPELPW